MPLLRSAARRASRKDEGFSTPCGGMAKPRTPRVVMTGRRDKWHALFSGLLTAAGDNPRGLTGEGDQGREESDDHSQNHRDSESEA